MFLLSICQWLDGTRFNAALRMSNWFFPTFDTIHTLGIVLVAGTIMLVDLRLLGLALRSEPVAAVVRRIVPWTLGGFALMFVTGALMFSSEAVKLYHSPVFRIKLVLLALAGLNALIFHTTIYRDVRNWDQTAPTGYSRWHFGLQSSPPAGPSPMVRATIWDDGDCSAAGLRSAPVLRVAGENPGSPDHPPLSVTDCAS
jgi:hypothetical protein